MSGQLVEQWPLKKLNEICDVSRGKTITRKETVEGDVPVVAGGINSSYSHNTANRPANVITVSGSGANAGFVNFWATPIFASDCSTILPLDPNMLDVRFVYYAMLNLQDYISKELRRGAAQPHVYAKDLALLDIPVPSLEEQQRIVNILDEAFENISNVLEQIVDERKNAEELALSLSNSMVSDLLSMCDCEPLESIAQIINGFAFASTAFSDNEGVKSIKITNVGVQKFVQEKGNYLPNQFSDAHSKVRISTGDIVIALTRTIIDSGLKVAIVPDEYDGALLNQRVAAIRVNQNLIFPDFLYSYLCSNHVKTYVIEHVNTLMQPNLSIRDLRTMPIPKPSLSKQKEVADILTAVALNVKNLKDTYEQKVENIEELKQSILQEAFNGTLRIAEGVASQS
jgi:type I restriction enzyme, S subunit